MDALLIRWLLKGPSFFTSGDPGVMKNKYSVLDVLVSVPTIFMLFFRNKIIISLICRTQI